MNKPSNIIIPLWLLIAGSLTSLVVGVVILVRQGNTIALFDRTVAHFAVGTAVVNLVVAMAGFVAALWIAWRKLWRSPGRLLGFVFLVALGTMLLSLLYRDDYLGGTCSAFDWPAGHIHAGYPYSWVDGEICVAPGATIREQVTQQPEEASWYLDLLALCVDALFWGNVGIVASVLVGETLAFRERKGLGTLPETA